MYVYHMHTPIAGGGQKRESDPLGLEFEIVVSPSVGAENQIQVLWKNRQYS